MYSVKYTTILIILGTILYSISLFNGFVWDDELMFNTHLSAAQAYFRPAMSVINRSLSTVFGSQPFIFHLASVGFHIATSVLLFYILKRFFKEYYAWFLALLFLVHPTNVEAVSFASALQEIVFTFIGLAGLFLCVRSKNISIITIFLSILLCTTALLTKETGIVFFAILFCYLLLFHRGNKSAIQFFLAFAIIALFTYGMARITSGALYVQGQGLFPIMRVTLATRLINIPSIILYYVVQFFFPFHLGIAQHWVVHSMDVLHFWFPLVIELSLFFIVCIFYLKTKNKVFLLFFFWFLIGLLPHLQIVPLNMTVAERWLYFPMIGLLGMIGSLCHSEHIRQAQCRLREESSEAKKDSSYAHKSLRMTISVTIIILLFVRSFVRILDWRNGLSLYGSSISATSSFDLQNNMGVELFRAGRYTDAKKYFEVSTRLAPYWWVNWNNGATYEREHNIVKAQECYKKAIRNGDYELAYENLAKIMGAQGRDKNKAKAFLKKALLLFPENETLRIVGSKL